MSPRGSAIDLPDVAQNGAGPPAGAPPLASPAARRPRRSRWRDPRLAVGIAIVAGCALLGSRLLGAADDTVGVWVARGPLVEGQPVTAADLQRRQVRFEDQAAADRYLGAGQPPPAGATVARAVGAGELLPRGALRGSGRQELTELPLSVAEEGVPATVGVGSVIDVWVTPTSAGAAGAAGATGQTDNGGARSRARLVLDDVPVLSAPLATTSLGPAANRALVVGLGPEEVADLPVAIAALSRGDVLLTARP